VPLFDQIRRLLSSPKTISAGQEVLRRVESFLAARINREVARKVGLVIRDNALADADVLEKMWALRAVAVGCQPEDVAAVSDHPSRTIRPATFDELSLPPPSSFGQGKKRAALATATAATAVTARPCCGHQAPREQATLIPSREQSRLKDVTRELLIVADAAMSDNFTYLDIGCSEGHITSAIVEAFRLSQVQAYACDIMPQPLSTQFVFSQSDSASLPYPTAAFDFATMFMAAHHFADALAMFGEARRVLKEGGLLLIRDHDCTSEAQRLFYDVVHAVYACVLGAEASPAEFAGQYAGGGFAFYRSKEEWVALARCCGFEVDLRVPIHGPWVKGEYARDRFDSFYVLLVAV
jgi:SAM-dependent methyltransferase